MNRRDLTFGLVSLIACTGVVGADTFTLSFSGLDDYGRRVAHWGPLSPLVPIGVDGLTLVAIAATSLLRRAPWHIRAYAWLVFIVAMGLSVAGNLSHAVADRLTWQGELGAAVPPLLLALASHLMVVTIRAIERFRVTKLETSGHAPIAAAPPADGDATEPKPRRVVPTKAAAVRKAAKALPPGARPEAIAAKAGVSVATVRRHADAINGHEVPFVEVRN